MTKIFSKLDPSKLLHMIVRKGDIKEGRTDLCPTEEFLQCATLRLEKGKTFRPHRHNWNHHNEERVTQESWCILRGAVKVFFYDTDDTLIHTDEIEAGELSFTFSAAHNYEILSDDSLIFEYKTGKYISQAHDKSFID
jgi:cupin fold WbuC family metalloprotein